VKDASGRVARWFGTNTDVSVQREAERTLAEHRDRLEALVAERTRALESSQDALRKSERLAALGTLAQGLAHDLNNLLLPLRIRAQTLAEEPTLSAEGKEDVAEIRGVADYLANLTRGLRLFARDPAAADRGPSGASTDLAAWFLDARTFLKATLPLGVALEADVPEGLPRVRVGQHALSQAVLNLVHNAGDAVAARVRAGSDGRHGIVELGARARPDGRVEVSVRDNGTGMPPEVVRRAMEPFFTTKPRGQGTGLGLAMVHGVVAGAGGEVTIESEVGVGTMITLVLPSVSSTPSVPIAPAKPKDSVGSA
jgi:signal transduction histidine kinase